MKMKIPVMRNAQSIAALHDMCKWLLNQNSSLSKKTILEIGTFYGDSAIVFAHYFKQVVTIDPYDSSVGGIASSLDMFNLYVETIKRLKKYKNIILHRMTSQEYAGWLDPHRRVIDIIYIDGLHTYNAVRQDIKCFLPFLKKDGWLCGHDYRQNKFPGVVQAVNEFRKPDKVFADYSWCIKLKDGR